MAAEGGAGWMVGRWVGAVEVLRLRPPGADSAQDDTRGDGGLPFGVAQGRPSTALRMTECAAGGDGPSWEGGFTRLELWGRTRWVKGEIVEHDLTGTMGADSASGGRLA